MNREQAELIVAIAEGRWADVRAAIPKRSPRPRAMSMGGIYDRLEDPRYLPPWIVHSTITPIVVESHSTIIFDDSIRVTSAVDGPLIYSDTISSCT